MHTYVRSNCAINQNGCDRDISLIMLVNHMLSLLRLLGSNRNINATHYTKNVSNFSRDLSLKKDVHK